MKGPGKRQEIKVQILIDGRKKSVTYINQRQNSDNRLQLVLYLFLYLFLRHQVARKHAWKGFIWMWIQTSSGSFLHFGNGQTAFEGKNRFHLYEDWHSRQETVKSCRLNPPVCKLLRFLFHFTMRIFVASSWNLSRCISNCSFKLQALESRDNMRVQ